MKPVHFLREIEGQGAQLEQVVTTVEQQLEGPLIKKVIQEFVEEEALARSKHLEPSSRPSKQSFPDQTDSG
jgi:hypothetical protein